MLLLYYKMMFIQAFTFIFTAFPSKGKGIYNTKFSVFLALLLNYLVKVWFFYFTDRTGHKANIQKYNYWHCYFLDMDSVLFCTLSCLQPMLAVSFRLVLCGLIKSWIVFCLEEFFCCYIYVNTFY